MAATRIALISVAALAAVCLASCAPEEGAAVSKPGAVVEGEPDSRPNESDGTEPAPSDVEGVAEKAGKSGDADRKSPGRSPAGVESTKRSANVGVASDPKAAEHEPEPVPAKSKVAAVKITEADRKAAAARFIVCANCHGQAGKGDGVLGKSLPVKPRNWTDKEWQRSVTDEHLGKVILEGGQKHGLSPLMTASPDLRDQPGVLAALVEKVRSFGN